MLRTSLLAAPAALLVSVGFAQDDDAVKSINNGAVSSPSPVAAAATAASQTVILTDVVTSPLSDVPGIPGAKFTTFDRPALSPNGLNWAITADTDLPTSEDDVLVVNGAVVLREGDSPSFVDPGVALGFFDQGVGINDAGQFAFGNDTNAPTTEDDYIVRGDGNGNFTVIAREGSQIDGAPAGWLSGFVNSAVITSAGDVGYESDSLDGTPGGTADNNVMMLGTTILAQKGVTIPSGQLSGLSEAWDDFDFEDLFINADGTRYILQGDLTGDTTIDDVVVVDGVVVIQEGFPLPGGPADVVDANGIFGVYMAPSGDWMADGDFDVTDQDWVVYNGTIVALEGEPIHVGATDNYAAASFFANVCNSVGDYIVAGNTDAADTTRDAVVVLNNERVVLREGDPVDIDGNGVFDDDLFFSFFGSDDFRLTDDLKLYFVSSLRNSSSTLSIGDVFMMIDLADGVGSPICVSQPNSTTFPSRISAEGSPVAADNNLTLSVCGLPVGVTGFFVTSSEINFVANPGGSSGDLCIASFTMGRYNTSVLTADAAGTVSLALDLTEIPGPSAVSAAMAGETRYWQYWHRDTDGAGMPTSNFSNGLCVTFQ